MSSTSNVQNFLVNVFRPVYRYDATTTLYTPKLELSNIDTFSGNTISVFSAAIGDVNNNVYIGSNAGNPYTTTRGCSNVTAIGFGAGSNISNVSNATYVGFYAGAGANSASNVVAIGANANGNGNSNVYIGTNTGGTGVSNVFIGSAISGSGSNNILIGPSIANGTSNDTFRLGTGYLTGNMNTKWLGIGTPSPYDANNKLDVSGNMYVFGQVGVNMVPVRTVDVNGNFRASDMNGTLDFNNGTLGTTGGFYSLRGSSTVSGGYVTIGTIKKGIILISAVDSTNPANRASRILFAHTTSNVTDIGSNIAVGNSSITTSSTDIRISDILDLPYTWSITYLPLA